MSCFYFVTILSAIIYSEIMMFSISNFSIILQISCENFIDRNVIRDCNLNMYCVFCNMSIVFDNFVSCLEKYWFIPKDIFKEKDAFIR
jgi:hypothetical protein